MNNRFTLNPIMCICVSLYTKVWLFLCKFHNLLILKVKIILTFEFLNCYGCFMPVYSYLLSTLDTFFAVFVHLFAVILFFN